MIYFDAAFIAKCYLDEADAGRVRERAEAEDGMASCELARIELASIFRRHRREGRLSAADAGQVRDWFQRDQQAGVWSWLPLEAA